MASEDIRPNLSNPLNLNGGQSLDTGIRQEQRKKNKAEAEQYIKPDGKGNDALAELCGKIFRRIVFSMIGEKYVGYVEDVTQQATSKACLNINQFTGDSSLRTWLSKLCMNEVFDFLRKMKVRRDVSDPTSIENWADGGGDIKSSVAKYRSGSREENLRSVVERILSKTKLDEDQKLLIQLFYFEGKSIGEIIELTGLKENTIKVKLFRARGLLRKTAQRENLMLPEFD